MKSLQECKEIIAKKYSHCAWDILCFRSSDVLINIRNDEAAELYASQFKEPVKQEEESQDELRDILVPRYMIENALDGLRIAANILNSRTRKTAADRQIEFSERLLRWVLNPEGKIPSWLPENEKS